MKTKIYNLDGEKSSSFELPSAFSEKIRPDIIKKAVTAEQANRMQPYGPSKEAGMRHATESAGKGQGIARVQRLTQQGNTAAESPPNVGGRRAHPPKPEKIRGKKINKKEKAMARRSALAATSDKKLVFGRGHTFDEEEIEFPIIVEEEVEDVQKTKEAIDFLKNIGVYSDVKRAKEGKKIRAGKGKMRGRKYKRPVSLLIVLSKDSKGIDAFSNLAGVTVKDPRGVTVEDLAPGGEMGRLSIFSKKALKEMEGW
ncbi:MAG: 50S ribosomal protein L4 [Candidatus Saliniplasma sp.]